MLKLVAIVMLKKTKHKQICSKSEDASKTINKSYIKKKKQQTFNRITLSGVQSFCFSSFYSFSFSSFASISLLLLYSQS